MYSDMEKQGRRNKKRKEKTLGWEFTGITT